MGIVSNLQSQQVMAQKANAFDQMRQEAQQRALAEQAANWGKQKGMAEMAAHVVATNNQPRSMSTDDQIKVMLDSGELTPEDAARMRYDANQFNMANQTQPGLAQSYSTGDTRRATPPTYNPSQQMPIDNIGVR